MSTRVYRDGLLVEFRDDDARTVTTYDETGAETSTRPYTEDENAAADASVAAAARLDDLAEKVAILWAAVFPPDPEPEPGEPVTAPAFSGIWHPGTLISDAGKVWLNVSGVPLTTAPSGFPGTPSQWSHLFVEVTGDTEPDPDPGPGTPANYRGPWSPDTDYAVDDTCSRHGRYWQALVAHGAAYAGTWGPPTTGVWTDLGPVA